MTVGAADGHIVAEVETMRDVQQRRMYRLRDHRIIAGVAGGMADYLGANRAIIRALWVIGALLMPPMTAPAALALYLILAFVLPPKPIAMSDESAERERRAS